MRTGLAVAVLLLAAASPARADDGYAARVIAVDAASDTLIVSGLWGDSDLALDAGLVGYAVGGPLVHATHGEWGRAGVSLLLRLGAPLVGGLVGDAVCPARGSVAPCIGHITVGVGVGMLIAQVVDPTFVVAADDPTPAMLTVGGAF